MPSNGETEPMEKSISFHEDSLPDNFMGIPEKFAKAETAHFHVLPVPLERSTSFMKGTRRGPSAIISASHGIETFDDELFQETYRAGIHTMDPLPLPEDPAQALQGIGKKVRQILRAGKFPLLLGGEHSLTAGAVEGAVELFPNLSVLQLDAHADMRDSYEGDPYSHACVMRRLGPICPFVQVGIRSICAEEWKAMDGERVFSPSAFREGDDPVSKILSLLTPSVYLTIDLDVFDPACMPGVGTPEPGGLTWYEVLRILRRVCAEKKVVAADVVELMPLEGTAVSQVTAAKLVYRLLGYLCKGLPFIPD